MDLKPNVGAVDYITKPFHPETLKKKVEFFLGYASKLRLEQHQKDAEEEYNKFLQVFDELVDPLWAILLNTQMLLKFSSGNKEELLQRLKNKLENVEKATKRLKDLIMSYKGRLNHIHQTER